MDKFIIETSAVNLSFGANKIFDNLSFQLSAQNHVGIIGKNGIGKSTFLKMLSGFYPEPFFKIKLFNKPLSDYSYGERAQLIAYVPQLVSFPFDLNLREYFQIYLNNFKQREGYLAQVIKLFNLEDYTNTSLHLLSGGILRKALIAGACLQGSQVLLLDEPSAFLDPLQTIELKKILNLLSGQLGLTYIIVAHEIDFLIDLTTENFYLKNKSLKPIPNLSQIRMNLGEIYG